MYILTKSASAYSPSYSNQYDPHDDDVYIDDEKYAKENYTGYNAYEFIDEKDYWWEIEEEYIMRTDIDPDELPNREDFKALAEEGKIDALIRAWIFKWRVEEYAEWLWDQNH